MAKLEKGLEDDARDGALRLYGVKSTKVNVYGENGWPDVLFWIPGGCPLLIEFKRPGEGPDGIQIAKHIFLIHQGYRVIVCDSTEEALKAVKEALDAAPVPTKGSQVRARSLLSALVARTRAWQDEHMLRSSKNTVKRRGG